MTPMANSPRVLILWAKPTATNLGIRALAEGAVALCRTAWPQCEIVLHDHDTEGSPLGKTPILADIGRRNGFIKNLARQFDVVLDTGSGDSFADIYGLRRLTVMAYAQRAVVRSGTPLIISPQTVGPFDTRIGRVLGRKSVRDATRLFVRDSASAQYCDSLGRRPDAISSDVVWMLDQPKASMPSDVIFNVSGLLWTENPHVDYKKYRDSCVRLVEELKSRKREVTLLAHVLKSNISSESDVDAVGGLAAIVGEKDGVSVFIPTSLSNVRDKMAGSNVVVGARMHACLNSLSVGTPAIPWAYSRKFAPLLNDIKWQYNVDLRSATDPVAETLPLVDRGDLKDEVSTSAEIARQGFESVVVSLREVFSAVELDRGR